MEALTRRSAQFLLDHGADQHVGLAWEHMATGLSASASNRWSAVDFDRNNYSASQVGALQQPQLDRMPVRTVVFDVPYINLNMSPGIRGIVGWGSHDAGTPTVSNEPGILDEITRLFGPYPAHDWMYACPAYSPENCREMGRRLAEALDLRRRVAMWLLERERENCDLFYIGIGEIHAAIEGLWHGIDPHHPLYDHPSAPFAAQAIRDVYEALDRLIGDLTGCIPDSPTLVFAPGGMGINDCDLQSMALLPELMYRHAFDRSIMNIPGAGGNSLIKYLPSKTGRTGEDGIPDHRGWLVSSRKRQKASRLVSTEMTPQRWRDTALNGTRRLPIKNTGDGCLRFVFRAFSTGESGLI